MQRSPGRERIGFFRRIRDEYSYDPDDSSESAGEEKRANTIVADLLPKNAEDFHYAVEQSLRGIPCSDRRITYHYVCKEMHWSHMELMKTPYEVVIRTATILGIEGEMKKFQQKQAELSMPKG